MNAGDPTCSVRFNGKDYIASLTMKLQAEKFMETSAALKEAGCSISVYGDGLLPDMFNAPPLSEQAKYELMWGQPEYRYVSPGESVAHTFVKVCRPEGMVIDFGCGTGRGGLAIEKLTECKVMLVEFTSNSRDPQAERLPFVQQDLAGTLDVKGDFGFCTDVLEHIPPYQIDAVIHNILSATPKAFFQISLVDDHLGSLIGKSLHLSVHPYKWWIEIFTRLGYSIAWSEDQGDSAMFYVTTKHLEK
jgi:SAM-dependent methyltransferase